MNYNLLNEPWIDVILQNGKEKSIGLNECFNNLKNIKDFKTPIFKDIHFDLYRACLMRFMSGIISDALDVYEGNIGTYLNGLNETDVKKINDYLNRNSERFDLLNSNYPFMQTDRESLKEMLALKKKKSAEYSSSGLYGLIPVYPGESGRRFGSAILRGEGETTEKNTPITLKESAYLLLYANLLLPGVGAGAKATLMGNSYILEFVKGENIEQTLLLNAPFVDMKRTGSIKSARYERGEDLPLWRDKCLNIWAEKNIFLSQLDGLFYPSRLLSIKYNESTGLVDALYKADLKFTKDGVECLDYNEKVDILRPLWQSRYEHQTITINSKDKDGNDILMYCKSGSQEALWKTLLLDLSIDPNDEKDGKMKIFSGRRSEVISRLTEVFDFLPKTIRFEIFSRVADTHWVYSSVGHYTQSFHKEIMYKDESEKRAFLYMLYEYVEKAENVFFVVGKMKNLFSSKESPYIQAFKGNEIAFKCELSIFCEHELFGLGVVQNLPDTIEEREEMLLNFKKKVTNKVLEYVDANIPEYNKIDEFYAARKFISNYLLR